MGDFGVVRVVGIIGGVIRVVMLRDVQRGVGLDHGDVVAGPARGGGDGKGKWRS